MRLAFPHALGREEARRRIKARQHEIAGFLPGAAQVTTRWPGEDRMEIDVQALGQAVAGAIEIGDHSVTFEFDLPGALGFLEPVLRKAIEPKARKLLA